MDAIIIIILQMRKPRLIKINLPNIAQISYRFRI